MSAQYQNIALLLARRQKRLKDWGHLFSNQNLNPIKVKEIKELLNTYRLLISKLAKANSTKDKLETDLEETENRVIDLERQIASCAEMSRLYTSDLQA